MPAISVSVFLALNGNRYRTPAEFAAAFISESNEHRARAWLLKRYWYWMKLPNWAKREVEKVRQARSARLRAWDEAHRPQWATQREVQRNFLAAVTTEVGKQRSVARI